jgi:NAD(P)H-dependent flavin oxidoreductase YrpB (nitropropane dioxygenase family)
MRTAITDMIGCEYPIVAFSHCRDVVAAVTHAGGFGVLGVAGRLPEELDVELRWLDEHTGGRGYGVDALIPRKVEQVGASGGHVPEEHRRFVADLLARYDVPELPADEAERVRASAGRADAMVARASELWDVISEHPVTMFVSALGPPPADLVEKAHAKGVVVGGLAGAVQHAERQKAAGVDLVVAQGSEAGGHCGEIATMVLVPDVVDAMDGTPVLAAGGIATGRQMAAALSLGAAGVWTGSVWLTTQEAETHPVVKEKMLAASASDTVRSRSSTGKHARQLVSAWTREWEDPANPDPLGMPHHSELIAEAKARIGRGAHVRGSGSEQLVNYFVGQVVGRMRSVRPARRVLEEMVAEYADTVARIERINAG